MGPVGPTGPHGETGPQGPKGDDGNVGFGIFYQNYDNTYNGKREDGSIIIYESFVEKHGRELQIGDLIIDKNCLVHKVTSVNPCYAKTILRTMGNSIHYYNGEAPCMYEGITLCPGLDACFETDKFSSPDLVIQREDVIIDSTGKLFQCYGNVSLTVKGTFYALCIVDLKDQQGISGEYDTSGGVDVTAKPGQLIRVKSVDENGKTTAWEPVPWGYTEGEMVEILPETTLTSHSGNPKTFNTPWGITSGKTYVVTFDGKEYKCEAFAYTYPGSPFTMTLLGDYSRGFDVPTTGEPFGIMEMDAEIADAAGMPNDRVIVYQNVSSETCDFTISISEVTETIHPIPGKLLPEGVPYVEQGELVEILPETTLTTDDPGDFEIYPPIILEVGVKYIVKFNGTEYTCIGQDASALEPGFVVVGNFAEMGLAGNGEPFVLLALDGMSAVATDPSLSQVTISVKGKSETIHKLDNRCLDLDWIPTKKAKETEILPEMFTSEYNNELKPTALPIGTVVAVYWDGVRHECTVSTVEGSEGALYFGYLGRNPFAFLAMYESLPYTIQTADGEEHTVSLSLVEYEYNVIPSGYLGESTSVPISLIDLGMPVATGSETILATDTSEVMKKLKNGSKVKAVFKARFETENGHTDGTVTAIFDGTRYFNGASTVKDTFIFSKMICMYACLYAVTLRVEDGQYVAGVHKLLDNSATEVTP